jgi:hypothetical protein
MGNAVVTVRDPEASITAADVDLGGSGMNWEFSRIA